MENNLKQPNLTQKLDFLRFVIESAEKRRDAVENKASILIAANAVLFTATTIFIEPLFTSSNATGSITWIITILTIAVLMLIVVSLLFGVNILVSISKDKDRKNIMDDIPNEVNYFYFGKIADYKKSEYSERIFHLSEEELFNQYVIEAHNLSRLLVRRYRHLYLAHRIFVFAATAFALVSIIKIVGV